MMKILLVDDDLSTLRLLNAMLLQMGHEVVHASDGQEAWDMLQREHINFVLSDWRMPRMDGVELCRKLRGANFEHYTYFVLFTGVDQNDDLIVAMEAGADDFLIKPVRAKELKVRLEAGRRVLFLEETLNNKNQDLEQANQALESSQRRIKKDLQAAADLQQGLLPQASIDCFPIELAWDLIPADELAGDLFNFFPLDEYHLGFWLVDVAGHGIPAAMLSIYLAKTLSAEPRPDSLVRLPSGDNRSERSWFAGRFSSCLKSSNRMLSKETSKSYREPKDVAAHLNRHFQADDESMRYFTMIYGVLDTRDGVGSLCQAGHPYPMICRSDGRVQRLGAGGLPIGLLSDVEYEQVDFQLHPGDRLLLYSDGITECFNPEMETFGEQRLAECLTDGCSSSLKHTVEQIKSRLVEWHHAGDDSPGLNDDASLLAIELSLSR